MVTKRKAATPTDTFILLDRSASMSSQWPEATSSINAYVRGLADREVPGHVTLAVFDDDNYGNISFEVVRMHPISLWRPFTSEDAQPRGNTPLYDAIGRLVNLAERAMPNKAVIVIMTDGQENASRAVSNVQARSMLDRCRERGWQVVFLGANFDTFSQGRTLGAHVTTMLNAVPQSYGAVMSDLAAHTHNYTIGGGMRGMSATGNVEFSAANRATAANDNNAFTTTRTKPKPKNKAA